MRSVDVFLLHGISREIDELHYYMDFIRGVTKYLPQGQDVRFHTIDWSVLLESREKEIFSWMKHLKYRKVRKFACDNICDILAYSYPKREPKQGDFIYDVHQMLDDAYNTVNTDYPDSAKIFIGHSLGSQIALGYTFEKPVDCLITLGSPILYFSIRYSHYGRPPNVGKWDNYFHPYDLISSQLGKSPVFANKVNDIQVRTGWNFRYFNPLKAHSVYWTNKQTHRSIAKTINSFSY